MPKRRRRHRPQRYNRRVSSKQRDFKDPIYVKWREEVKARDNYKCQWPGCESRHRIEVHHIKTWASCPELRFSVPNGITLCSKCHRDVKGKEKDFESFFFKLLEWQVLDKIKKNA